MTLDSLLPIYVVFTRADFENLLGQLEVLFTRNFGPNPWLQAALPFVTDLVFLSPITGVLLTEVRLAARG